MRFISHRGNLTGWDPERENTEKYIIEAIGKGFDVEIDVWYLKDSYYLGHDSASIATTWEFLNKYKAYLWIHCKNVRAAFDLLKGTGGFNFFSHDEDNMAITSRGYFWMHPRFVDLEVDPTNSIIMDPRRRVAGYYKDIKCYGICSDFIQDIKADLKR